MLGLKGRSMNALVGLFPCPLCGSDDVSDFGMAVLVRKGDMGGWCEFYVGCNQCGCRVGALNESDDEARIEARKRWNARKPNSILDRTDPSNTQEAE